MYERNFIRITGYHPPEPYNLSKKRKVNNNEHNYTKANFTTISDISPPETYNYIKKANFTTITGLSPPEPLIVFKYTEHIDIGNIKSHDNEEEISSKKVN